LKALPKKVKKGGGLFKKTDIKPRGVLVMYEEKKVSSGVKKKDDKKGGDKSL
jgi:hypothetical protein